MVIKINVPYNAIFGRPLLNELCAILSPRYLTMKFEIEKEITSVRGDQVEAKKGCMLVTKMAKKQSEMMTLEALREWDKRRERRAKPQVKPTKIELNGLKKVTLVGSKLFKPEKGRITDILRQNVFELYGPRRTCLG